MVEKTNIAQEIHVMNCDGSLTLGFFWGVWLGLLTKTWLEDANLLDKTKRVWN
jgi:hypothetical protein